MCAGGRTIAVIGVRGDAPRARHAGVSRPHFLLAVKT
jgi:hypothetical protein